MRSAEVAALTKELQGCAEVLPAELKDFVTLVAPRVVQLCAVVDTSEAKKAALRNTWWERAVPELEAEHDQAAEEATKSLELFRAEVVKVADQVSTCAAAATSLDARARATLHTGLVRAALGTHAAAEAKAELAPLLAAAEELQAAVKPAGWSLGAVGNYILGRLGGKRAREDA